MLKNLITQYLNINIKKIENSTKVGLLFLDLNIFIIHFFLINNIGFFLFLILLRYALKFDFSSFFIIFCLFSISFILLITTFLFFAFKNKKFRRFMVLRYTYPRLTFLIGNSFLKAAVQRGWVGVGFAAGAELATEAMNSYNKREEIKVCAEENRKTAEMLPEKERTPYLKRQQST